MKQNKQKINRHALATISLILFFGFILTAQASEINAENVVKYVNEARVKEGLRKLTVSEKLTEVATAKVNDMVANKYFAHTSPKGFNPWHWFELSGYDYKYAGENLAINFITAEAQQEAWMKSPTHKKNILNVNYSEIGVAVAVGEVNGTTGIIAVQEFGTLAHPGKAGSDSKDFASAKDKTLPDMSKFIPTVLSTGDQKVSKELKDFGEKISGKKTDLFLADKTNNFFWLVMFAVIILPIAIVQVVFMGKLIGASWFRVIIQKSYAPVSMRSTREYFKKLRVKNYGKYQIVKVRRVGT